MELVQQFKLMVEDGTKHHVGGVVLDVITGFVIGFVSFTDNESVIGITLFSPHPVEYLPSPMFDKIGELDYEPIFKRSKENMDEELLDFWNNGEMRLEEFEGNLNN